MSVPKYWLLGGWFPRRLIVHQQRCRTSDINTNVEIKCSAYTEILHTIDHQYYSPSLTGALQTSLSCISSVGTNELILVCRIRGRNYITLAYTRVNPRMGPVFLIFIVFCCVVVFSFVFLCHVSYVPNVASFSGYSWLPLRADPCKNTSMIPQKHIAELRSSKSRY